MGIDDEKYLVFSEQISEQQTEVTKCVNKLDKKLDLNIQKTEYELSAIRKLDEQQNKLLEEHMRRTELAELRLDTLEQPRKVIYFITKLIIGLGSIAGAVYAISRFLSQ